LEAEHEALRIQAAAVIAQQASLTEEEARLRQQRLALERQKEQLAGHLEQRRQHLLDLQEQVRQDRAACQADCDAARQEQQEARQGLDTARAEVHQAREEADRERRRLRRLRQRLKQRWHRHWDAQVAELAAQRRAVAERGEQLRQQAAALEKERAAHVQALLRFNGDVELGRRRLQDEWQQLGLAQQQWEATLNAEHARRGREQRELERRAAAVAAAEKLLKERLWQGEQRLAWLHAESRGVEARAQHLRQKLLEEEEQARQRTLPAGAGAACPESPPAEAPGAVVAVSRPSRALCLREARARVAAALADQRLNLLEQWGRLLTVHEAWQGDRCSAQATLEEALHQVEQRERHLLALEQGVQAGHADLLAQQRALSRVRCTLEGWHARLTAREAGWQADREAFLAELREREEITGAQAAQREELCRHRLQRCEQEIDAARRARAQCEDMRRDYVALWQECQERRGTLAGQQRELAARALSLENLRQGLLTRAADPAAATRRLERLRRQHAARLQAEEKSLHEDRQWVAGEVQRLQQLAQQLRSDEAGLLARKEEWAQQETARDEERAAAALAERQRHLALERLQTLHALDQQQVARLRDEIERVARLLMDEAEPAQLTAPPASQAA
jgi:hypothetical protein